MISCISLHSDVIRLLQYILVWQVHTRNCTYRIRKLSKLLRCISSSVILQRANLKTGVSRKQSKPKFPKKGIRHVCFSEILACFTFLKHPFWDSPFCLLDFLKDHIFDGASHTIHETFTVVCLKVMPYNVNILNFCKQTKNVPWSELCRASV